MDDEKCDIVKIMQDGFPGLDGVLGWVVVCCEEHDPLMRTWDTKEDAMAELDPTEWWEEEPGIWMAEWTLGEVADG
jgi:hypothetical protein